MYQYILFDLDGTLTDPGIGITNSVAYALEKYNISVEDRTELYKFIGPPLQDSFMEFYGFSEMESKRAVEYYREYFRDKGIFENEVYEGIPELLQTLKGLGKQVILATSKPEEFARQILEHFDLIQYFDFVAGATMDGLRSEKSDIIQYALEQCMIKDTSKVIMVGDRKHDIIGAAKNKLPAIGVLFGYGSEEELRNAGAKYLARTSFNILKYIEKECR